MRLSTQIVFASGLVVTSILTGLVISAYAWGAGPSEAATGTSGSTLTAVGTAEPIQDVSRADLDAAFGSMLACLDDNNIPYEVRGWRGDGSVPMWDYVVGPFDSPDAEGSRIYDECWATHLRAVQSEWAKHHQPSPGELAAFQEEALACADELGYDVEDLDELRALVRNPQVEDKGAIIECVLIGLRSTP